MIKVTFVVPGTGGPQLTSKPMTVDQMVECDSVIHDLLLSPNNGSIYLEGTTGSFRIPKKILEKMVIFYCPVD